MRRLPNILSVPLVIVPLVAAACDDEEEVQQDTGPTVGVMELPISLRNADAMPSSAVRIEISPAELRADGQTVVGLDAGRIPDAEKGDGRIPKLAQVLQGGPARRAGAIRLHVNTPYETTALVLGTLKAANMNTVAFEVREPGGSADTGWSTIEDFRVEPEGDEAHRFPAAQQRRWDELVEAWQEVYEACRRDHYVDCAGQPFNPAEGGEMEIRLFARGSALKVEMIRFGMDEEDEAQERPQPQMIEGVPVPGGDSEEEEEGPPVTQGAFTWRFEAATDEGLSPITGAFRPLCGARPCGVVVTGDPETMTMRLVSFVGAAFPNGTESPHLLFELP